ncbi:MAG: hypothetical protein M3P06_01330 [Acidobacteriota bacterium]|nr:hypothetical protein [Acidobacteriota bacterium]
MPGPIYHVAASAICPHGGQVTTISSNTRVLISGMQAATVSDTSMVAGCVFTAGTKPQPCVLVKWLVPAVRVKVNGQPVLLQTSAGLCQSVEQIPQGPPAILTTQTRVVAT